MVFQSNLYFIDNIERKSECVVYTLHLNPEHIIYKAHFPGEPITPGVCILQIGVELLADAVGSPIEINVVKNVKFLSILHPNIQSIRVEVNRIVIDGLTVNAQVVFNSIDKPIAKMSLICLKTAK